MPPMPVEASEVEVAPIDLTIAAVGNLIAWESAVIAPEIGGRLTVFLAEEGRPIAAGAVIARLEDSVYQAELAQARATLDLARADLERFKKMRAGNAATDQDVQIAEATLAGDVADIELAEARLAKTEIVAPFDGIVGLKKVSIGDYLEPGAAIVNLEQIDRLKVDFRVPELAFSQIAVGQEVSITVDAWAGESFRGRVYAIDPALDTAGRSILIRAEIPNAEGKLRPGMFARVALIYDAKPAAILIPEQALVSFGDKNFVYRIVEGKAVQTPVERGERIGAKIEIVSGLAAGDYVVTAGQIKLQDGAPVQIVPAAN